MSPANNIDMNYDAPNDVLYVMRKGAGKDTRNMEILPGVFFRVNPDKKETVGLIIHNASVHYPGISGEIESNTWQVMEMFDFTLDLINNGNKITR